MLKYKTKNLYIRMSESSAYYYYFPKYSLSNSVCAIGQ